MKPYFPANVPGCEKFGAKHLFLLIILKEYAEMYIPIFFSDKLLIVRNCLTIMRGI
jgi:hypothetical protein